MAEKVVVDKWIAPDENDARILGMPNIPSALFGRAPRTVMGIGVWNIKRRRCYHQAGYKCEICGKDLERGQCEAHEYYNIDYRDGSSEFVRLICLCSTCHRFIHSGRMLSAYKRGDKYMSKGVLLNTVEHGFKIISEWNKKHDDKILVYTAINQYIKVKELTEPIQDLINKYGIEFYSTIPEDEQAAWEKWRLVYNGIDYPTIYKDKKDLADKMAERDIIEGRRQLPPTLKGGVFDDIDKILGEEEDN